MKATTDQFLALDVRQWRRLGLLSKVRKPARVERPHRGIVLAVEVSANADRVEASIRSNSILKPLRTQAQAIQLSWTRCQYGGSRPWFICPQSGCNRRAAILYINDGAFQCRRCAKLTYACQLEMAHDRAYRRLEKASARLGQIPMQAGGIRTKSLGMHQKTFTRLMRDFYLRRFIWLERAHSWIVEKPHPRGGLA